MSKKRALEWWQPALCGVSMLLYAAALHADVYTVNVCPNTVRLFDEPCATSTGWLKLKRAEMRFEGKLYAACWVVLKTVVLVFDEAGDITPIVVAAFRKEEGV